MQAIKIKLITIFLVFMSLSVGAQISDDDLSQELKIDAETQSFDIKNGILRFTGSVRVNQGSMLVTANELSVQQIDGEGTELLTAKGSPATYRQIMSNGKLIEAQADFIEYDVAKGILVLKENAQIDQSGSLVKGQEITYNISTEQLQATGSESGMVTTILKPKAKKEEQEK